MTTGERTEQLLRMMRQSLQGSRAEPAHEGPLTPPWEWAARAQAQASQPSRLQEPVAYVSREDFQSLLVNGRAEGVALSGKPTAAALAPDVALYLGPQAGHPKAEGTRFVKADFLDVHGVVQPLENCSCILGLYGPYRCLSNYHMHPVTVDGLTYACAEAAYMAQKTLDEDVRRMFAALTSAKEARELGQQIPLRADWDQVHRYHAMYRVKFAKFQQDPQSRAVLLATGTKYIEESNWWGDDFWGKCTAGGRNHLGQLLMTLRMIFSALELAAQAA